MSQAARIATGQRRRPSTNGNRPSRKHSRDRRASRPFAAGGNFLGTPGSHTTPDTIAAADPDVLLFAWCGAGNRVPLDRVIAQRNWHHLRAVRNRQVYCIPDELFNTPAPTLLQGLSTIAYILHPALFPASLHPVQLPSPVPTEFAQSIQSK